MARSISAVRRCHASIEVVECPLEFLLRQVDVRHVLERAQKPDDLTVEVAERDLVRLDPGHHAVCPSEPLEDPELRVATLHHRSVPFDEPVGAELAVFGPWHVSIALAEQESGFEPGEVGERLVAPDEPGIEILPENGVRHRIHQDLQHLLAGRERLLAGQLTLQERGVHVADFVRTVRGS